MTKNNIVAKGLRTMVGIGMIGVTSGMVNQLPAGTAKNIAGVVPLLQATSLVSDLKTGNHKHQHQHKHQHKHHKTSLWPKIHG